MKQNSAKYLYFFYFIGSLSLLLYSYTQVDLGLTLTKVSIFQTIQRSFQYIGYFQRPLSTALYIIIILYFYFLFVWAIYLFKKQLLTRKHIWKLIITLVFILVFSYPAFSYDLFNYMFTAKTVVLYHENPYTFIPLQLSGIDPWLGFLHWTHAVSAYPPLWILLTLIPYILGFGYFLIILFNFKLLIAGFFIMAVVFLEKTLLVIDKKNSLLSLILFALNPFVIVEVLVSGHNDIVLIVFAVIAFYFYLKRKILSSIFMLSISAAFKSATLIWFPLYFFRWHRGILLFLSILSFIIISIVTKFTGRNIQPWYFLIVLSISVLLPNASSLQIIIIGITFGLLCQYIPFLYFGNWDPPVPTIKMWLTIVPIFVSIAFLAFNRFVSQRSKLKLGR